MFVLFNSKTIVKNTLMFHASFMLNQVLRTVYLIIVARMLGSDLYGLLAYGQAWYLTFLPICILGLSLTLTRSISVDRTKGAQTANQVLAIQFISITSVSLICLLSGLYFNHDEIIQNLIIVFSLALIARAFWYWCESMFIAYEAAYEKLKIEKIFRPLDLFVGVLIAYTTKNILYMAIGHAIIWYLQAFSGYKSISNNLQTLHADWNFSAMKNLIISALPLAVAIILNSLLLQIVFLIYKYLGAENSDIANLSIGIQALLILTSGFSAISQAVAPAISRTVQRKDNKEKKYLLYSFRIAVIFGCLAVSFATFIGKDLVIFVLGNDYSDVGENLYLVFWILIPFIIKASSETVFGAMGKYHFILFSNLMGIIITLISLFYFAVPGNIEGVILSMLLGYISSSIVTTALLYKVGKIQLDNIMFILPLIFFIFYVGKTVENSIFAICLSLSAIILTVLALYRLKK